MSKPPPSIADVRPFTRSYTSIIDTNKEPIQPESPGPRPKRSKSEQHKRSYSEQHQPLSPNTPAPEARRVRDSVHVDMDVNGNKRHSYEFDETHEADSALKQAPSSSPRQESPCSNTLITNEIKTHIEQQVIAVVDSRIEELEDKMKKKIEEKMQQMFDDHKSDKGGIVENLIQVCTSRKRKKPSMSSRKL